MTFVATLNIILQLNLRPLLLDITDHDYGIDRHLLWKARFLSGEKPIKAVIAAHLFGQPCLSNGGSNPWMTIPEICRDNGWRLIEDSCETMGVSKIAGDIACYSTYVAHLIATGIGGLAITNNKEYAELMRSFANHGRDPFYIPGFRKPDWLFLPNDGI